MQRPPFRLVVFPCTAALVLAACAGTALAGFGWAEVQPAGNADAYWNCVAMSADGVQRAAAIRFGRLYTSSNSGTTWTERRPAGDVDRQWYCLAMSADGTQMILGGVEAGGRLYTSANSGAAWTERQPAGDTDAEWASVAISSDGTRMLAVAAAGRIYTSSNSGVTWTERQPIGNVNQLWEGAAMSSDGTKLLVCGDEGGVYTSTNSGATWTARSPTGGAASGWIHAAMSGDGTKMAVCSVPGRLYTSDDSGATWTERRPGGDADQQWYCLTISADGTTLIAGIDGLRLYTSGDSGATWSETRPAGDANKDWFCVALSTDGTKVIVGDRLGRLYGGYPPTTPTLTTTAVGTIGPKTAASGGTITNDNGSAVTARGVCWNTTGGPTTSDSKTSNGTGTGSFTSNLTTLTPNTPYYVRAYATNGLGTAYGNEQTFTSGPPVAPTVTTTSATLNGTTGFDAGGDVTDDGGAAVTDRGICWSTAGTPVVTDGHTHDATGTGSFISAASGLSEATHYYFRAYAVNSAGTGYGPQKTIVTGSSTSIIGYGWTKQTSPGARNWTAAASSGTGAILAACDTNGKIHVSGDSGATWTMRSIHQQWSGLASSADGTRLAASARWGGSIYTSSDSGTTWVERTAAGSRNWGGIASSSDGLVVVAWEYGGYLYVSLDGGLTWTRRGDTGRAWHGAASSSDGISLAAVEEDGYAWTSTDAGVTWTQQTNSGQRYWSAVASSSDGRKLVAAVNGGRIYTSSDAGSNWTAQDSGRNWSRVASSADGQVLAAAEDGGLIYTSTDSGVTWTARQKARAWSGIAMSSDGTRLVATVNGGYVYTADLSPLPVVETASLTLSGPTSASCGGEVIEAGAAPVTAYGLCWNTAGSPTISSHKTVDGSGISTFTSAASGLTAGMTFYFRAYASNSQGTAYGEQIAAYVPGPSDPVWTETRPIGNFSNYWHPLAISSDGGLMLTGDLNGTGGYLSTNCGTSWGSCPLIFYTDSQGMGLYLGRVVMSSNGVTMLANGENNAIGPRLYVSTDSGASWTETRPAGDVDAFWAGLAVSSDGGRMLAVSSTSNVAYVSTNGGNTWTGHTINAGVSGLTDLCASSDGMTAYAAATDMAMWATTDAGTTWTNLSLSGLSGTSIWRLGCSADGTTVYGATDAEVFSSSDNGTTWTVVQPAGNNGVWYDISCSADGQKVLASGDQGLVFSPDGGINWHTQSPGGMFDGLWFGAAVSGDGTWFLAGGNGGRLWLGRIQQDTGGGSGGGGGSDGGDGTGGTGGDGGTDTPPTTDAGNGTADDTGTAQVSSDSMTAVVTGLAQGTAVAIESDAASGSTTLTLGDTNNPILVLAVDGVGADSSVDVAVDTQGNQTVVVTDAGGATITLGLNSLPQGATVGVSTGTNGAVTVTVTDASGAAADVAIVASGTGLHTVFTVTYNPAPQTGTMKRQRVLQGFPGMRDGVSYGNSVTIAATGLTADAAVTVALSYSDADTTGIDEADLHLFLLNESTGTYALAGTRDVGVGQSTGVQGDYGVDTAGNSAWAVMRTLGTFAVGRAPLPSPPSTDDSPTTPPQEDTSGTGTQSPPPLPFPCGLFGAVDGFLLISGLMLLRRRL